MYPVIRLGFEMLSNYLPLLPRLHTLKVHNVDHMPILSTSLIHLPDSIRNLEITSVKAFAWPDLAILLQTGWWLPTLEQIHIDSYKDLPSLETYSTALEYISRHRENPSQKWTAVFERAKLWISQNTQLSAAISVCRAGCLARGMPTAAYNFVFELKT